RILLRCSGATRFTYARRPSSWAGENVPSTPSILVFTTRDSRQKAQIVGRHRRIADPQVTVARLLCSCCACLVTVCDDLLTARLTCPRCARRIWAGRRPVPEYDTPLPARWPSMTPVTRTRTVFVAADAPAGRASVGILLGVAGLVGAVCLAVAL